MLSSAHYDLLMKAIEASKKFAIELHDSPKGSDKEETGQASPNRMFHSSFHRISSS